MLIVAGTLFANLTLLHRGQSVSVRLAAQDTEHTRLNDVHVLAATSGQSVDVTRRDASCGVDYCQHVVINAQYLRQYVNAEYLSERSAECTARKSLPGMSQCELNPSSCVTQHNKSSSTSQQCNMYGVR